MNTCVIAFDLTEGADYTKAYELFASWGFSQTHNGKQLPESTVYSEKPFSSRPHQGSSFPSESSFPNYIKAAFAEAGITLTRICVVFGEVFTECYAAKTS